MKLSLDATQTNCSFVSIAYEVNLHAGHQVEPLLFQNVELEYAPYKAGAYSWFGTFAQLTL
jgi:hypothetical protein